MVWDRPFKDRIQERYDDWLANAKHEYTAAGNMKPFPRRLVVEWIIESWEEISTEMVANSMKSGALALAIDGSEDGLISCFKEGENEAKQSIQEWTKSILRKVAFKKFT